MSSRLQIKLNVTVALVAEAVATIKKVNQHYGLEPLAAYEPSGTGLQLIFASNDRIVTVFVELLPAVVVEHYDRCKFNGQCRLGNHYATWRPGQVEMVVDTKSDALRIMKALDAPTKVRTALDKAKVKTWESFLDSTEISAPGGCFKHTVERGLTSNVSAEWEATVENLKLSVTMRASAAHAGIHYHFMVTTDLWDRAQLTLQAFRDAGFDLFRGNITG